MCAEGRTRRSSRERGLTITELMVAMGLTALVSVMLLAAAQVQTRLSGQDNQTQYTQDNVRSAVEELAQAMRRAGTSFQSMMAVNAVPPHNPQRVYAITVLNNPMGVDSPDAVNLIIVDDSDTGTLVQNSDQFTNPLLVDKTLAMGRYALFTLTNFNHAVLYQLAQPPAAATLGGIGVFALTVTPPPVPPVVPMFRGAIVNRAQSIGYRIDTTIIPGTPVLVMRENALAMTNPAGAVTDNIVAENIEDLQVAIGVDGLFTGVADGVITQRGQAPNDDEWVHNVQGEAMPMALPKGSVMAAVRITVVGRTSVQEEQPMQSRPAVEDRPGAPVGTDGYRRRVLTTQVSLRSVVTN